LADKTMEQEVWVLWNVVEIEATNSVIDTEQTLELKWPDTIIEMTMTSWNFKKFIFKKYLPKNGLRG
jgi:hypothetical protein